MNPVVAKIRADRAKQESAGRGTQTNTAAEAPATPQAPVAKPEEGDFFNPQSLPQSLNKPVTLGQKLARLWNTLFRPELLMTPREQMLSQLLDRLDKVMDSGQVACKSTGSIDSGQQISNAEIEIDGRPYVYAMEHRKEVQYSWGDSYTVKYHHYDLVRSDRQVKILCKPLGKAVEYENRELGLSIQSRNRFLFKKARTVLKRYGQWVERINLENKLKAEAKQQEADRKLGQLPF